jgi:hypothetical protein
MLLTFSMSDAHTARPPNVRPKSFSSPRLLKKLRGFASPEQIGNQERGRTNTTNKIKPMTLAEVSEYEYHFSLLQIQPFCRWRACAAGQLAAGTESNAFLFSSYHHLDIAIFESARDRDTLTISFLNHGVRIAGTNLRELAVAIQGRAVEVIKPMPGRYNAAAGSGIGLVESIEVEINTAQGSVLAGL